MLRMVKALIGKISVVIVACILFIFIPGTAFADTPPVTDTANSTTTPTNTPISTTTTAPSNTSTNSATKTNTTTPTTDPTTSLNTATSTTNTTSSVTNQDSQTGPTTPPGPASNTYTYDPSTGLWVNGYYAWNPVTDQTTPLKPQTYSYNPTTGMWDTTQWVFNPVTNSYQPNVVSVPSPPLSTNNATNSPALQSSGSGTTDPTSSTKANSTFNGFYNASISNKIASTAQSGNATVAGNTSGGNATSGNAADIANVINMLQSAAGLAGADPTTFEDNVYGNVTSNLLVNPATLQSTVDPNNVATNVKVNNVANGQINNNVSLAADSGNATVANNTSGGNATSGSADSVANIMNLINSAIAAKHSFLGIINIYGNLSGNILVPSSLLNSLLTSNGSTSAGPSNNTHTTNTVNNVANQSINNQITTNANTGQSGVASNTSGGNATSGKATTNVTVFNLTGSQIIGSNSLLVFVNVLGQWVGFIMNAPAGTTAAALGGGITSDTNALSGTANINNTANERINNTITADAQSGNASVNHNTLGGNATSGDASSSVNLLNMTNSDFSLSNWFGVLFINVFGKWFGSLEATSLNSPSSTPASPTTSTITPSDISAIAAFHMTPANSAGSYTLTAPSNAPAIGSTDNNTGQQKPQTLLVSYTAGTGHAANIAAVPTVKTTHWSIIPLIIGAVGVIILVVDQIRARNHRRQLRKAFSLLVLSSIHKN